MSIDGNRLIACFACFLPAVILALPATAEQGHSATRPADAQPAVQVTPSTDANTTADRPRGLRYLYTVPPTAGEQSRPVQSDQSAADEFADFSETDTADPSLHLNRYPSYFLAPRVPYPVTPGSHLSQSRRNWANYRYFGGRPSLYGHGRRDPSSDSWYGDAYREGFMRGHDRARFDRHGSERTVRVLGHGQRHLERGKQLFEDRQYAAAADAFKLAADTNHGDPSSRLYAAHALFATGRYREAVQYLRRAFELQPKIAMLNYDLRSNYGIPEDYDEHLDKLLAALRQSPENIDRLILLGYIRYYGGDRENAHTPLVAILRRHPKDSLARLLLNHCPIPDVVADQIDNTK